MPATVNTSYLFQAHALGDHEYVRAELMKLPPAAREGIRVLFDSASMLDALPGVTAAGNSEFHPYPCLPPDSDPAEPIIKSAKRCPHCWSIVPARDGKCSMCGGTRIKSMAVMPSGEVYEHLDAYLWPGVRQETNFECGAASTAWVANGFGVGGESLKEVADVLGTTAEKSTSPQAIIDYLRGKGLDVQDQQNMTVDDLVAAEKEKKVCICPCQDYVSMQGGATGDTKALWPFGHYVTYFRHTGESPNRALWFHDSSMQNMEREQGGDVPKADEDREKVLEIPGMRLVLESAWVAAWHDIGEPLKKGDPNSGVKYIHYGISVGLPEHPTGVTADKAERGLSKAYDPEKHPKDELGRWSSTGAVTREEAKNDPEVFWHGSPSGKLVGGTQGLHLGTYKAAKQALEARIGIPAEGEWDGTREYGKTLLAGKKRLLEIDPKGYNQTGYNSRHNDGTEIPEENYYPRGDAVYSGGSKIPLTVKPSIEPYRVTGEMKNKPEKPISDESANRRGPKLTTHGYYYRNEGEDSGSVSVVVPNVDHLEKVRLSDSGSKAFDPDKHPRDHGKFANKEGDSSELPAAAATRPLAGDGAKKNSTAGYMGYIVGDFQTRVANQYPTYKDSILPDAKHDSIIVGEGTRCIAKHFIACDVGARMKEILGEDAEKKMTDFIQDAAIEDYDSWNEEGKQNLRDGKEYDDGMERKVAASITETWAHSSSDNNALSLAVQERVRQHFKLYDAMSPKSWADKEAADKGLTLAMKHKDVLDAYIQATYENTQATLKKAGVDEMVLFRGMRVDDDDDDFHKFTHSDCPCRLNPLSSFATNYYGAKSFSVPHEDGQHSVIMAVKAQEDAVLKTPGDHRPLVEEQLKPFRDSTIPYSDLPEVQARLLVAGYIKDHPEKAGKEIPASSIVGNDHGEMEVKYAGKIPPEAIIGIMAGDKPMTQFGDKSGFDYLKGKVPDEKLFKYHGEDLKSLSQAYRTRYAVGEESPLKDQYPPAHPEETDTQKMYTTGRDKDGHNIYTPERQALHDQIIAQHFASTSPVKNPVSIVLGGGTAAGKSSITKPDRKTGAPPLVNLPDNLVRVDSDDIVMGSTERGVTGLPEFKEQTDKGNVDTAAAFTHEESSDIAREILERAAAQNYNVLLDGTGDTSVDKMAAKIAKLSVNGQPVRAIYVTCPTEKAVERARIRAEKERRDVPEDFVREVHPTVSQVYPQLLARGLFTGGHEVWDNDNATGKVVKIEEGTGADSKELDPLLYRVFLDKAKEKDLAKKKAMQPTRNMLDNDDRIQIQLDASLGRPCSVGGSEAAEEYKKALAYAKKCKENGWMMMLPDKIG